ncbi:MAG: hypothetical protein BGO01_06880 [Armatimonadetes bacterium 55-13]|nr:MAG: hypothetical protein BGO01_06880 [Armatimonadetes bacterium 55-13]
MKGQFTRFEPGTSERIGDSRLVIGFWIFEGRGLCAFGGFTSTASGGGMAIFSLPTSGFGSNLAA